MKEKSDEEVELLEMSDKKSFKKNPLKWFLNGLGEVISFFLEIFSKY